MVSMQIKFKFIAAFLILGSLVGCNSNQPTSGTSPSPNTIPTTKNSLSSAASYTPYDAIVMLWTRAGQGRNVIWTNSGPESCSLPFSKAQTDKRPDWALCTQGVVAGLAAKGEKPVIIATVYHSDQAILPVFRKPPKPVAGSRTLPIFRSSIEFALSNLVKRENTTLASLKIPKVEKPGFPTITALLTKPVTEKDALDFAILVDPFITNVMKKYPNQYEIGKGGLYDMYYSVVVPESDLKVNRAKYVELLRQLIQADEKLQSFSDAQFYQEVWGRKQDGKPERLPKLMTYNREPAHLAMQTDPLRQNLKTELKYLVDKYPDQLKMPDNPDVLVDPSLLKEIAPDRVSP